MKKALITLLAAGLLFTSTACSTAEAAEQQPAQPEQTSVVSESSQGVFRNDNQYDIQGEIVEIIGNEVTLKLMLMDAAEQADRVPGSGIGRNGGGSGVPVEKNYTGEELTLIIPVGTPIVTRVPGQSTGETMASGTGTGPTEKEMGLNELTKGMYLKIRYLENGTTVAKILVQKPRA